jgi:hypothetical protein
MHTFLNFEAGKERGNKANFLDMTTINQENKIEFDIFREPTIIRHTIYHNSVNHFNVKELGIYI